MKTKFSLISTLLLLAMFVAACGSQPTAIPDTENPANAPANTEVSPTQLVGGLVEDFESLVAALRAAGVTVEPGEAVEQAFFTVPGQIIKVNDADVQVFVYGTAEAMEAEAAQVADDGGSIGTNMVTWVATPHFYKAGRILVLYVGDDQAILDLLQVALGPQFAGR